MLVLATVIVCLALACLVYGWFEAGWLRTRVLDVEIEGLAVGLDGLRIAHLSDFHLGAPLSRGNRASEGPRPGWSSGARTSSASPATWFPILAVNRGFRQ